MTIILHTYNTQYNNTIIILSGHSDGGTHSFWSSSIIVPLGHSHPPSQIRGHTLKRNLLAQVVGQLVQFFWTCPLTGQVAM